MMKRLLEGWLGSAGKQVDRFRLRSAHFLGDFSPHNDQLVFRRPLSRRSGVFHDAHLKYPRETQAFAGSDGVMTDDASETDSRPAARGGPPHPRYAAPTAHRDTPAGQAILGAGSGVARSSSSRRAEKRPPPG